MSNDSLLAQQQGVSEGSEGEVLVRTGPDSELARMNTLVSLSPNVKRTLLST